VIEVDIIERENLAATETPSAETLPHLGLEAGSSPNLHSLENFRLA
jgi:hypothetical protein